MPKRRQQRIVPKHQQVCILENRGVVARVQVIRTFYFHESKREINAKREEGRETSLNAMQILDEYLTDVNLDDRIDKSMRTTKQP